MYLQLIAAAIIVASAWISYLPLLILLIPLGYINRYELLASCADFVLITLHILGLVPDPRYKTSHNIGIYTELDLIQHFEDVALPAQLSILQEYRLTLQKLGRDRSRLPQGLDEADERVTFSREFQQTHNLFPLPTPTSSFNSNNGSVTPGSVHADDDFILAKKQQRVANQALGVAATGITIGATYAAKGATALYSYASQKYSEYQSNQSTTPTTISTLDENGPTAPQSDLVNGFSDNMATAPNGEDDEPFTLGTAPAKVVHTPTHSTSHPHQTPSKVPPSQLTTSSSEPIDIDNLNSIVEETDTLVDSFQRSFSSLFSTRKSLTSHYVGTVKPSSRFSIQSQGSTSTTTTAPSATLASSQNQHPSNPALTTSSLTQDSYQLHQPAYMYQSADFSAGLGQSASPAQNNNASNEQISNQLRARLDRLSNRPQVVPDVDDLNESLSSSTPSTAMAAKPRKSYVEKYRKMDQEKEDREKQTQQQKGSVISSQISQNKTLRKLEQQLTSYLEEPTSSTMLSTFFSILIRQSSLYHSVSRSPTSLPMLMSNKYKESLTRLGAHIDDKCVNVPLLFFRFVDYSTIHLVMAQFAYTYVTPTLQPSVPLQLNGVSGTKQHPTLNVITSSLPQDTASLSNAETQIVPMFLLSSTLTTYNIHDIIYVLNNYAYDNTIQKELQNQQNSQIRAELNSSNQLSQEHGQTLLKSNLAENTKAVQSYIGNGTFKPEQSPISTITIPHLYDKSHLMAKQENVPSLALLSQDRQLAGENSAIIIPFISLSHVVPGRRRSLYNAPVAAETAPKSPEEQSVIDNGQAAINSLHHSLFFSVVCDTDIYDFICLTSHQRDVLVTDLKAIVAGIVGNASTTVPSSGTPVTTVETKTNPAQQEQTTSGYNLRPRKKPQ